MKQRFGDRVQFLGVYVREAHPTNGWHMLSNEKQGISIAQPTSKKERTAVAARCCEALHVTMPLLVDDVNDHVGHLYSGMPDRLYVIGQDGRVVYKGGRGPFGFNPGQMEQALIMHLLDLQQPRQQGRLPMLDEDRTWKALPPLERGTKGPLPTWARATAGALPRTTAAMLELDYRHRAASLLDARLRGKMRWVAARANGCTYAQEYALADLKRAGASDAELTALAGDRKGLPEAERAALDFADKLTRAAYSVSDDEVRRLRQMHGDARVVAMVQLLAHANFQDRLLLALGVPVEPGGPLPPLAVMFQHAGPSPAVPPRRPPADVPAGQAGPRAANDSGWTRLDYEFLQKQMEGQRGRSARIEVPSWEEVRRRWPEGYPQPPVPIRIRWTLVCMGYQPELAAGWSACTRAFAEEARQDRVFEESLFWVVTRSLQCFY